MAHRRSDIPPDPAPEYTEWIQHRYDPGYWTGGRLPPHLRRKQTKNSRGNPYGWLLLLGAASTLIEIPAWLRDFGGEMRFLFGALLAATVVLTAVAGVRLLAARKTDVPGTTARRRHGNR